MKIIYAFVLCWLALVVSAEVRPVIIDRPLAISPDPSVSAWLQLAQPRQTDNWLNVRLNSDTTTRVQNEQQIVVNALNSSNLVAVWRDFRLGYRRVGMGRSFDGGRTWFDSLFIEPTYPWQSDPGLTWHTSGAIYSIVLSFDPYGEDGLFVSKTNDGGLTWGPFTPAVHGVYNSFEDKELITCDRSGSATDGNLYVAWTRFTHFETVSRINLMRSVDDNQTWEGPYVVSDSTGVQWPVPAVGGDGEVYVAWVQYNPTGIMFDKSLDGGVTWGNDILVQPTAFGAAYLNPDLLIFAYPAMDVDLSSSPFRGSIYIAYADEGDWSNDVDLYFTASYDGGLNWSTPLRVNDDPFNNGCDQFHPWLICDENGVLHLIFYDRRNDPQNLFMDVYYTCSTNGGLSWSPNERITEVSSNPGYDSLRSGLIGEYNGLAVRDGVIHPIWTDTRSLHQDTYTAVWDSGSGINDAGVDVQPATLDLELNVAPNPFNDTVQIELTLQRRSETEVAIYTLEGRLVEIIAEGELASQVYRWFWQPQSASGIFFVRATNPKSEVVKKVVYLR